MRDDRDLASGARMPRWSSIAESDEIKHRFLGRPLRLFVPCPYGQNKGLFRQSVRMPRVERGVEIDHRAEFAERICGKSRIRIGAIQVAAQGKAETQAAGGRLFHAPERIEARPTWERQSSVVLQVIKNGLLQLRGHAHRTDALDVRMTANRE